MPSPYMQDLFETLTGDERFRLRVYYLEMAAPDTYWGQVPLPDFAEILPGKWFWFFGARTHYNPRAARRLIADRPDVVVVAGYAGLTNQLVMRALRRAGIPWVFYGELPGMNRRGRLGRMLRAIAQRPAVRWPAAIAAVGTRAAIGYGNLASASRPVHNIPYCCDMQSFQNLERRADADGDIRFLYCGQLIPRKGVDLLLDAFLQVARENPRTTLSFVGEGPLRVTLEKQVPLELSSRVHFAGFQPVAQLPAWFANSDVLVLPSRHDGWGVVVNQALAAGLAIVCSDAVGAAADLVKPGDNGLVFPAGDRAALAHCLQQLAADAASVSQMGRRSHERALEWTPRQAVQKWYDLLLAVLSRPSPNS